MPPAKRAKTDGAVSAPDHASPKDAPATPGVTPPLIATLVRAPPLHGTTHVLGTRNLIRETIAEMLTQAGRAKADVDLTLGDPTKFGAPFEVPRAFEDALVDAVRSRAHNGYVPAMGTEEARAAVAGTRRGASAGDVVVTSGCSAALEMALRALAGPGDVVAVPCPAFPLYETILEVLGVSEVRYALDPAGGDFLVDLASLAGAARAVPAPARVKAVVFNNPSNPAGSVWPLEHLARVVDATRELFPDAVLLADEVYDEVVFGRVPFHAMGVLAAERGVPAVTEGGVSKNWMAPGWRLGWLIAHDPAGRAGRLDEFRRTTRQLSAVTMGACTVMQAALPAVLAPRSRETREELAQFRARTNDALRQGAAALARRLRAIDGVGVHAPQGAMYMFATLDLAKLGGFQSARELCQALLEREGLLLLPGECFRAPFPCIRISIAVPEHVLMDAADRLARFQAGAARG